MAQRIELWPLSRLKPYERNARTHSAEQVAQIAASIVEFGFTNPLLVDSSDGIIAGHGRLQAAQELGLSTVPVVVLDHLSDRQRRAYILADNQLALNAGWDLELLRTELQDLVADDFDLSVIGFSDEELSDLLPEVEELAPEDADEEAVPEIPEEPITKPGDVWLLGKHRLMCGDSTNLQHVERLMDGCQADFVYMDPPYGMKLDTDYSQNNAKQSQFKGNSYKAVEGDFEDYDPRPFIELFKSAKEQFWWGADYYCQTLSKDGSWVVWDKRNETTDEVQGAAFELCWSIKKHHKLIYRQMWCGYTAREKTESRVHPTQKPVAMAEWFFNRWGAKGDIVVDLYGGSGTTLIASEKTERHCRMMELDPAYCDVIVQRWQQFTGKLAVLEDAE